MILKPICIIYNRDLYECCKILSQFHIQHKPGGREKELNIQYFQTQIVSRAVNINASKLNGIFTLPPIAIFLRSIFLCRSK